MKPDAVRDNSIFWLGRLEWRGLIINVKIVEKFEVARELIETNDVLEDYIT